MYYGWLLTKIRKNNWGDKPFVIWRGQNYSYSWLLERSEEYSNYLSEKEITLGKIVAVEGDYSPQISALILALIKNKNIIVPISTDSETKKKYYLETSESEYICAIDASVDEISITQTDITVDNHLLLQLITQGSSGLVLFTSGSTGQPKAALHNLDKLLMKYLIPRKTMRSLVFLRIDHIGGINTLFSLLSNGGTIILSDDRTPEAICRSIAEYKVELLPTTPSFLNLLLISEAYKDYDLSSLKLITYGTEVMTDTLLKKLRAVFPNVEFKQTYGLTEVGILRTKSESSDSPWVKVGGENYEIKVVDGILWIKSDHSILGYLNAPSPFTEDGWLVTKDKVEIKGDYLRFLGREEEIINVGGLKVFPSEIEDVIMKMSEVDDVVIWGEKNPILGNIVCAKVFLKSDVDENDFRANFNKFCKSHLDRFKIPQKLEISKETIPTNERFKKMRLKVVNKILQENSLE